MTPMKCPERHAAPDKWPLPLASVTLTPPLFPWRVKCFLHPRDEVFVDRERHANTPTVIPKVPKETAGAERLSKASDRPGRAVNCESGIAQLKSSDK